MFLVDIISKSFVAGESVKSEHFWHYVGTLKLMALGAHQVSNLWSTQSKALTVSQFSISFPSWVEFLPKSMSGFASTIVHFQQTLHLRPPSLVAPATLSFFSLGSVIPTFAHVLPPPRSLPPICQSQELDCEWERCLNLGQLHLTTHITAFKPGSMEGAWEGIFAVGNLAPVLFPPS
jgi:hypothetical protein